MPPVSTLPLARPKNMNASSESGLCATVIFVGDISLLLLRRIGGSRVLHFHTVGPQRTNDRGDAIDREVDVVVGGGPAETEPDGRAGAIADRTNRLKHMRWRLASGAAGRTG